LIYSKITFLCCILFGKVFKGKQTSHLANHKRGFSDWKHMYRLEEHENSPEHKNSYLEWKLHRRKSAKGHTIRKIKVEGNFKDCA
jgi:hypothetical protein